MPSDALFRAFTSTTLKAISCLATFGFITAVAISHLPASDDLQLAPPDGIRQHIPHLYALTGARIVQGPGRIIEEGTLVIQEGKILAVGKGVPIPPAAEVIDLSGKTIYPGFIDAYGEASPSTLPRPEGAYWNEQIRADERVSATLQNADLNASSLRKAGFVARLMAPSKGIIRGYSGLYQLGDGPLREQLLKDDVALHGELTISRASRIPNTYPGSPMGAVALARQAFYDAQWDQKARVAVNNDPTLPVLPQQLTLAAMGPALQGQTLFAVKAGNELFSLRADRFAREFNLNLLLIGHGMEYRRLNEIASLGRPIVLPVAFPKAPAVGRPEEAQTASLTDLMHWDHAPENLARLHTAGVTILLTTDRLEKAGDFLNQLRIAIARGFPEEAALKALTTTPAELFGVDSQLGTLESGKLASFLVVEGNLFSSKGKILETWVSGVRFQEQEPPINPSGVWDVVFPEAGEPLDRPLELILEKKSKLTGRIRSRAIPDRPAEEVSFKVIELTERGISGQFPGNRFNHPGTASLSIIPIRSVSTWQGKILWADGTVDSFAMTRREKPKEKGDSTDEPESESPEKPEKPDASEKTFTRDSESKSDEKSASSDEPKKDSIDPKIRNLPASFPVNFPFGPFGRIAPPEPSELMAFTNATIWTSGPQGTLEGATLLIENGTIRAVGTGIDIPSGATVVDLGGRHITPGLIDCHSHFATDGGINEATQAITAEVRIGDFIDCDDINIYRQLAGGVTTSNIMHGSANPIGGQTQVVKLRWGASDEEMKFAGAPAGIKFALGENVKRSNSLTPSSRYPQTRMGVPELMQDAFMEAREYAQRHRDYAANPKGIPPRIDLELEALNEILEGERWIHCHSYRQDEILEFLATLEMFNVRVGSLQHILEGYKVAEALARHGATASTFADWWAYKLEVYDAIPHNGAILYQQGVIVSFNSDDREMARRLNQEAAKAIRYGQVPPEEALKFVTLNPARQLRIHDKVGSLEPGKDADFVIWSDNPLTNRARCEQTWIDGRKYFDLEEDAKVRERDEEIRNTLVQKIITSGAKTEREQDSPKDESELWPRYDEFCTLQSQEKE